MESFLIRNTFGHKLYELYKFYKPIDHGTER